VNPQQPAVRILDPKTMQTVWNDFEARRKQ
jgi:hypothetical protein